MQIFYLPAALQSKSSAALSPQIKTSTWSSTATSTPSPRTSRSTTLNSSASSPTWRDTWPSPHRHWHCHSVDNYQRKHAVASGSVLHQHIRGSLQSLAFYSHKLSPTETWYTSFNRELLAVFDSICHYCHMVKGRRLLMYTDHKPLCSSIQCVQSSSARSNQFERKLLFISEFTMDLCHVYGDANVVAGALSQHLLPISTPTNLP